MLTLTAVGWAGKSAAPASDSSSAETDPRADFDRVLRDWKELVARLRQMQAQYQFAKADQQEPLQTEYAGLVEQGKAMAPRLLAAAERAYAAAPNQDTNVTDFLSEILARDMQRDQYDEAARIAKLLIDNGAKDKTLYAKAGMAAVALSDFANARKYLKRANDLGEIDQNGNRYLAMVDSYDDLWKNEQAIREAEAKADNLPRVKLSTNKGDIVVELFEDQAPIATANFIFLVEQHFYDGIKFQHVVPGVVAEAGDLKMDTKLGYSIRGEGDRPDHRMHFRGTLTMGLNKGNPDSGGTVFMVGFVPLPQFNERHTNFGRVIEGLDVLSNLEKTELEGRPLTLPVDSILKATVLRKRDREYLPEKLPAK